MSAPPDLSVERVIPIAGAARGRGCGLPDLARQSLRQGGVEAGKAGHFVGEAVGYRGRIFGLRERRADALLDGHGIAFRSLPRTASDFVAALGSGSAGVTSRISGGMSRASSPT